MQNFRFYNPTEVIFGKDAHKSVGIETKKYGTKVMLLYGSGHIKKTGLYDQIVAALKEENIVYIEFGGVQPNPRLEKAREGVALAKENGIDFILAVGGGSVIDSAKGYCDGGSVRWRCVGFLQRKGGAESDAASRRCGDDSGGGQRDQQVERADGV